MIETTYVRISQAAAMLDTDEDTLLIAAAEGRISAHWLLNSLISAEYGEDEEMDEGPPCWIPNDYSLRHFMFIPLESINAASLLKSPTIKYEPYRLSKPDSSGRYWVVSDHFDFKLDKKTFHVTRNDVFFARSDIANARAFGIPVAGTIPPQAERQKTPRDSSLIGTIAALIAAWPNGKVPSGKDLEKAAQSVGLKLSDDTIRKVLSAANEIAPTLPMPK